MIISYLGPIDFVALGEMFDMIKMKKDKEACLTRSSATQYLRDWKVTKQN